MSRVPGMGDDKRVPVMIAGIALGICALAGIAYSLGWLPPGRAQFAEVLPPKPEAKSEAKSDIALLPGETLVSPPPVIEAPAPAAAPAPPAQPPAARKPSPPKYTKPPPRRATPKQTREEKRLGSYERSTRSVCVNCGVVTGITQGDYQWEVRVRFDDGSRKRLRYYDRPRVEIGDSVRLEDDRLVRE